MKQILSWDNSYESGYLETEDDGRPLRIFNASGQGSYSSGGYWEIEDVIFNFNGMRDALLKSAGEARCNQVIAYLNQHRDANYPCSPAQRNQTLALFAQCRTYEELVRPDDLIDVRQYHLIYEEERQTKKSDRRILFRTNSPFMIWVDLDPADNVKNVTIVDGWEAQDLDIKFGLRFSTEQKKRLLSALIAGRNGMQALQSLYSPRLIGLHLLGGPTPESDGVLWAWHISEGGVLTMKLDQDGNIMNAQLDEGTQAYWWIRHPAYILIEE